MNVDVLYGRFGELVRRHRRRVRRNGKPLSQQEVGKRVGLSRTSITNIERGRQKVLLHQLYDLAEVLETTPESLLPSLPAEKRADAVERKLAAQTDATPDEREWMSRVIHSADPQRRPYRK